MKSILKTVPKDLEMKHDEKFSSEINNEIMRDLIPRLIKSLKRYKVTYSQVRGWLQALHKHRRVRYLYSKRGVLDRDNRRLHKNNRTSEVNKSIFFKKGISINIWCKARRIKGAYSLYLLNDERITQYNREQFLGILENNQYHSLKDTEVEKEKG